MNEFVAHTNQEKEAIFSFECDLAIKSSTKKEEVGMKNKEEEKRE